MIKICVGEAFSFQLQDLTLCIWRLNNYFYLHMFRGLTNIFALYLQFKFDYLTATYFLLLEKKMKGRPVRLLNKIRNHEGTGRVVIFHYLPVYLSFMMSVI